MPTFTLDETGLQTPRFPEARALVVEKWKARFGDDAQTGSDSPDGLIIDVIALMLALAWEGVAAVYTSSFFRTAAGTSLDLLLDMFGRRREQAEASTASSVWYGDAATLVPEGSVASVETTGDRFATDADGTTTTAGGGGPIVVRILEAVDANTYAIDVDTTTESTVVAGAGSTPASIADAMRTQLATDNPTATVTRAGEDPETGAALIVLEALGAGVVTVGPSADVADDADVRFAVRIAMTAESTGPKTALAGNLNTIETPVGGIDGVSTTADADVGRDIETDEDFRDRHLDQLNSGGAASPEAIRARLLDRIDDMRFVRVFENESNVTDADGRPPHSFEVVWIGPAGTETEDAVAAEIFAAKAAGIQAYGDITSTVTDAYGDPHSIGHSRGTVEYLHLDVTIVPGEDYPTVGDPLTAAQEAIATYLGEGGDGELGLGVDFYRFALGRPISEAIGGVSSVLSITVTADSTPNPGDTPTLVGADITVDDDAILDVDSSRISVHL